MNNKKELEKLIGNISWAKFYCKDIFRKVEKVEIFLLHILKNIEENESDVDKLIEEIEKKWEEEGIWKQRKE